MGRFVQIVIGPAGVGKSFYCKTIQEHCQLSKRTMYIGNLDPAAEYFEYNPAFDVRDLVNMDSAMEEFGYGPNGALVYCMEYLYQNSDWLHNELDQFGEDDYVILDCPGQIELYSHLPIMHNIVNLLTMWGFRVVSVYLLDALFVLEPSKFISGCMLSLSCMLNLELPHINVITKCDIADKEQIAQILDTEGAKFITSLDKQTNNMKLRKFSQAISSVIDDYMIVSFVMLDVTDEESIEEVLNRTDHAIQYGEDIEPKEPKDEDFEDDND